MVRTPEGVRCFHANQRCVTISSAVPHGDDVTLGRLEDQIARYDMKSGVNQRWYTRLKAAQLVWAAAIPVIVEALTHEKYLYLAHAGSYAGSTDGTPLLADRIEGLISQEHAKWVSARQEAERAIPGGDK